MAIELIFSFLVITAIIIIIFGLILLLSALLLLHSNRRCSHRLVHSLNEKVLDFEYLQTNKHSVNKTSSKAAFNSTNQIDRFSWIGDSLPCFRLSGKQISVLTEPTQFFETLKVSLLFLYSRFFFFLVFKIACVVS